MPAFFYSLRFRLMMLVLVAVLPAFILVINNASEQRRIASEQVVDDALQLAWITADHHNELIQGARQFLFSLAQLPVMHEGDPQACRSFLAELKTYNPRYANIVKADLNRRVICDAIASSFAGTIPDDGFPQEIIDTKSFTIGNYVISPTAKKPTIGFGYPLLDEDGDVESLLIVALDLASLDGLFSQVQLPPDSTLTLRDRHGTILSRYPESEKWVGLNEPDFEYPEGQTGIAKEGTIEAVGSDGITRLYAFAPFPTAPKAELSITVGIPKEIAFAEVDQMLTRNLLTLGIVTVLAFGLAWIFSDIFLLRQTRAILSMTKKLASGDLSARTGVQYNNGELSQLAQAFDNMGVALEKRDDEWMEVHEALKREEGAHARLLHKVITAHEDERMRIARELHDETSQSLTAMMIGLDTARLAHGNDGCEICGHLQNVKSIADSMLTDIHRIIGNLRPSLLDDLGLVPAIAWCGERLLNPSGIQMDLQTEGLEERLPPMVETVIFRVVQEALTNITRHSNASRVEVQLKNLDDVLCLRVADNGQGYDPAESGSAQNQRGFGLESMRERVTILDGQIDIQSAPGKGTIIHVSVPINRDETENV